MTFKDTVTSISHEVTFGCTYHFQPRFIMWLSSLNLRVLSHELALERALTTPSPLLLYRTVPLTSLPPPPRFSRAWQQLEVPDDADDAWICRVSCWRRRLWQTRGPCAGCCQTVFRYSGGRGGVGEDSCLIHYSCISHYSEIHPLFSKHVLLITPKLAVREPPLCLLTYYS